MSARAIFVPTSIAVTATFQLANWEPEALKQVNRSTQTKPRQSRGSERQTNGEPMGHQERPYHSGKETVNANVAQLLAAIEMNWSFS